MSLVRRAGDEAATRGQRLLLVLDQFEEVLVLGSEEATDRFARFLRDLAVDPPAGLTLLLVLRTEYEPRLLELDLPRLRQGETWLKLGAFAEPAAKGVPGRLGAPARGRAARAGAAGCRRAGADARALPAGRAQHARAGAGPLRRMLPEGSTRSGSSRAI